MSLSVLEPAPVSMPSNIKVVGIVNRTKATKENQTIDAIHKALSLETNELQTQGALSSIQGLTDELKKNNRFNEVKPLNDFELRSFGAGVFPSALQWDSVENICRLTHTDALFSLELFDTDSKLNYSSEPTSISTGIANIPAIQHHVNMTTFVKTGWRIYDPASRTILDEFIIAKDISFSGSGINPVVAASALIGRKEAVKQVGDEAGKAYGFRIIPYWIRVSREYFVGGNENFTIAKRKAQAGNWDGAAQIWQLETTNSDSKIAGRACYNMAIINEINGDLEGAIHWAQKSYENYNNRLALEYLNILRNRKSANDVLRSQNFAAVDHG